VVLADSAGKTVAYTRTLGDGGFTIDIRGKRALKLTVRSLGYREKELPINEFLKQSTITLEETAVTLREVHVRPDKIRERGDTLTYNVTSFAQEQDRSIADVIRKMPGLSVADNGQISFEGQPIDKFYVEGMDLLGENYMQASENLHADKVSGVQVIQNHQEVKSLRGVEFSDNAALNIVLKDEAKGAWAGLVELGAGTQIGRSTRELDYEAKLMAMLFGKKRQNLSMYKCDNTGKDISRELGNIDYLSGGNSTLKGIIGHEMADLPDIDSEQTRFNVSHLLATNQLFKTQRGNDLRLQADYLWNKEHAETLNETSYTDIGGAIIAEEDSYNSLTNRLKGDIAYKINTDRLYLSSRLQVFAGFDKGYGSNIINGITTRQSVKPHKTYATEELNITKTGKNGGSISFSSTNTYGYLPGRLLTIESETERINLQTLSSRNAISFRRRHKTLTTKLTAALSAQAQSLKTRYNEQESTERFRQFDLSLSPSVNYEGQVLKINAAADICLAGRHLDKNSDIRLTIRPHLLAQYALCKSLLARLIYNYTETPVSILSVYSTPVFVSHRTKTSRGGEINDVGNHLLNISIAYKQPIKSLFANMSVMWIHRGNEILFQSQLVGDTYLRTPSDYRRATDTYRLSLAASHSLYWGKSTISADLSFTSTNYSLLYQEALTDWRTNTINATVRFSAQPAKCFSIELKSSLNADRQCPSRQNSLPHTHTLYYKHKLYAYLFPSKGWEIGLKTSIYHSPIKALTSNVLLGSHVSYKTRSAEFRLVFSNILGNTRYSYQSVGTYTNTCTTYRLRPREIVGKVILEL